MIGISQKKKYIQQMAYKEVLNFASDQKNAMPVHSKIPFYTKRLLTKNFKVY